MLYQNVDVVKKRVERKDGKAVLRDRWCEKSAFSVNIDTSRSVWELKNAIKAKMYQFPARKLQLFQAKMADGKWLSSNDSDFISMQSGTIFEKVQNLLAEEIGDVFEPVPQKKRSMS